MSYYKCKNLSIDLKKEKITCVIASNNICPLLWETYEYKNGTFLEKLTRLCADLSGRNIQFQDGLQKKERLAFIWAEKQLKIEYPFKTKELEDFSKLYLKILTELKSDKSLSKKGYIKWSNKKGTMGFVESYSRGIMKTNFVGNKMFTKLQYLLMIERLPKEHYLEFVEVI